MMHRILIRSGQPKGRTVVTAHNPCRLWSAGSIPRSAMLLSLPLLVADMNRVSPPRTGGTEWQRGTQS